MLSINYCGKEILNLQTVNNTVEDVKRGIYNKLGIPSEDYYLLSNGKHVNNDTLVQQYAIHIIPRLVGGKGGFGSMLRAIGAQIEKTTNREACRDLSGRRLRDINEEKRLKTWIAQQVEREKEAEDRRQRKLERLCRTPKHEFKDEVYEKERSALPEKVEDALSQGLKASTSSSGKRKNDDKTKKNKKAKLWMGSDEELSSSEETDSEGENKAKAEASSEIKDSSPETNEDLINPDVNKNDPKEVIIGFNLIIVQIVKVKYIK
ncbi:uncharacterized protein CBL_07870 [Carabus blaptoides fortunei]